jgi:hypothetical protein
MNIQQSSEPLRRVTYLAIAVGILNYPLARFAFKVSHPAHDVLTTTLAILIVAWFILTIPTDHK